MLINYNNTRIGKYLTKASIFTNLNDTKRFLRLSKTLMLSIKNVEKYFYKKAYVYIDRDC